MRPERDPWRDRRGTPDAGAGRPGAAPVRLLASAGVVRRRGRWPGSPSSSSPRPRSAPARCSPSRSTASGRRLARPLVLAVRVRGRPGLALAARLAGAAPRPPRDGPPRRRGRARAGCPVRRQLRDVLRGPRDRARRRWRRSSSTSTRSSSRSLRCGSAGAWRAGARGAPWASRCVGRRPRARRDRRRRGAAGQRPRCWSSLRRSSTRSGSSSRPGSPGSGGHRGGDGRATSRGDAAAAATALMMTATAAVFWGWRLAGRPPVLPARSRPRPGSASWASASSRRSSRSRPSTPGARRIGAAQAALISTVEPF